VVADDRLAIKTRLVLGYVVAAVEASLAGGEREDGDQHHLRHRDDCEEGSERQTENRPSVEKPGYQPRQHTDDAEPGQRR
jgi:hypothetical protein